MVNFQDPRGFNAGENYDVTLTRLTMMPLHGLERSNHSRTDPGDLYGYLVRHFDFSHTERYYSVVPRGNRRLFLSQKTASK